MNRLQNARAFLGLALLLAWAREGAALLPASAFISSGGNVNYDSRSPSMPLFMAGSHRRGGRRGGPPVKEVKPVMNEEITATELRVVTPNPGGKDKILGIMPRNEALATAKEMGGLDLILINEKSDPPVCKIVDYSKYRYMQEKKAKELKKNSKATEIKEVKMSYKIDVHDYDVRMKNAAKFMKQGNRVKATVMFRGREVQHDKLGFELLDKFAIDLEKIGTREGRPKREGRNLSLIFSPRAEVLKQINEQRKADEKAKKKKKNETKPPEKPVGEVEVKVVEEEEEEKSPEEDALHDIESSLDDLLGGSDDDLDDIFS